MSELDSYNPTFIMRCEDPTSHRIIDLWTFRSTKSHKRYIVEVEGFDKEFIGIKFYWKGVEKSPDRYSLLTNDYEPRTIVMSCIEILMRYFMKNNLVSFGFVAAPDLVADIKGKNATAENRRYRFYRNMMLSLFGEETFVQIHDISNTIYLMVNRQALRDGILTIQDIELRLNQIYTGEYHLTYGN